MLAKNRECAGLLFKVYYLFKLRDLLNASVTVININCRMQEEL